MNCLASVSQIEEFKDVPIDQLQWLVSSGKEILLKVGERLFAPGDPVDRLLVVLQGEMVVKVTRNGQHEVINRFAAPGVTGLLPYSRAEKATGYGEALSPMTVLALDKSFFHEMICNQHELTTALVHTMSNRIKSSTKLQQQNEKMMALGKLSAGLAHELNNPSSAVVRSAQSLSKHLKTLPQGFKSVIRIRMTDEQVDEVNDLLFSKLKQERSQLGMLERSNLVDEIMDRLDDLGAEDSDEMADALVEFNFTLDELDRIAEVVNETDLPAVLGWLSNVLTTERLVEEIEEASQRISDLVVSVKSYTHMDQGRDKRATDIHKGLKNTLKMLNHKVKKSNIEVVHDFSDSMPEVEVFASELNQVWTNVIDNAIDAMEDSKEKRLIILTDYDAEFAKIEIIDTGSGMTEEVKDKIFDPFFTTKDIGKGTGLGLELVHNIVTKKHEGIIAVESKPGKTTFRICLPLKKTSDN